MTATQSTPSAAGIPVTPGVLDRFRELAESRGDAEAMRTLSGTRWSWGAWYAASREHAAALVSAGIAPGDRVAILASNRPVWPIADVGALLAGVISVGIYPTSAPAQLLEMLADSQARAIVVDSPEQLAKVLAVRGSLPALERIIAVEGTGEGVERWSDWLASGARALAEGTASQRLAEIAEASTGSDIAVMIYTSGSTGQPKGACISLECLRASAASTQLTLGLTAHDTSLSFLPFSHAGERMFGLYTRILVGMPALLVDDVAELWNAARTYEPTLFGGMPRFYEKVSEALRIAEGAGASSDERRVVVQAHFGRRMRLATSGGATLPLDVARHLEANGVVVLGAYGQTEHLCVAFHRPDRYGFESVGRPMPGTELRIADDGELLVRRNALTFSGYHGRPEETRAAFTEDGEWLLTGDLGTIAADGQLTITGRKKELIALSTGKKIAPLPIEAALTDGTWISGAMLYGEGRKYITALLCLARPGAEQRAREAGVPYDAAAMAAREDVRAEVQRVVDRVNARLSKPEQVKRWLLVPTAFSVEGGELTPTMKLRRAEVTARYAVVLDALYDGVP